MPRSIQISFLVVSIAAHPAFAEVAFQKHDGSLNISVDGKPFAVYVWNDTTTSRPYFKQVFAAGGEIQITRSHPPATGDFDDHPSFHPGVWWGFGDVGGNDYWRLKARIIGGDFVEKPRGGQDRGHFAVRNRLLINGEDETFCEQICRYTILKQPQGILMVCESTFRREQGGFWLGDQEEMGLAVRVATPIAIASGKGGRIRNSENSTDLEQIRTRQSDWCDYSGPIAGHHGGILLMNDPNNFRKPWWHAVNTGLLIANPLGESELNGRGKKRENVRVKAGESFRLRYGVLVHLHDNADAFDRAQAYSGFLKTLPTVDKNNSSTSQSALPRVPDGFQVAVFAQEPLVYKPTSICFDTLGRLFVGQGPQYPKNFEDSPTDSVSVLTDSDHDGVADKTQEFAKGFNSIQGLAWKGDALYVANAPELTVVRDLDGDDEADEYVMVYTDLGNREHALHGLNWGPDGKLYMSKGNSKGHNQPDKTGYVAPWAFRELWDVEHPPGAPNSYPPQVFTKETYRKTYHYWDDDWGREGGVLRCDPLGKNLEIVSRGLRNPWDIALDAGFNWLGTDNDQTQGDRLIMPFFGAHFGWGHLYSSHWSGQDNLPTVPVSGPLFPGSGAGIIYYDHEHFPAEYRQVFFVNDWLNGTFVYRPEWDGALMQPRGGAWQAFARRGEGDVLYRPTDLEFSPDGAIFTCGWGGNYHYEPHGEGSWIFRISYSNTDIPNSWRPAEKRSRPISEWDFDALLDDLGPGTLPVWRVNAQDELVRRGAVVRDSLIESIEAGGLSQGQQTWAVWALGRMLPGDAVIRAFLIRSASRGRQRPLNLRLQSLRVLAYRVRKNQAGASRPQPPDPPPSPNQPPVVALPDIVPSALEDAEPRIRFDAVQAIHQARAKQHVPSLIELLATETDRLVYYAGWRALRDLCPSTERQRLLEDARPRIRLAALLGLQEDYDITLGRALAVAENELDPEVQSWALTFAMNPRPPTKMPNTTARVELEQSISAAQLIDRVGQAIDQPKLRTLYLKMLSRGSFRGRDLDSIRSFYETLQSDEDRALVLLPLARSKAAGDLMWEAFRGAPVLQRAAVEGWHRMVNHSVQALRSGEAQRREALATAKQPTNVEANRGFLVTWLLDKMSVAGPRDERVACAVEVLSEFQPPLGWDFPASTDATLAAILANRHETMIRSRVLSFLQRIEPRNLGEASGVRAALRELCAAPDPRFYRLLASVTAQWGMDVNLPRPQAATSEGVLAALAAADANRGRQMFFASTGGADCAACHRVDGRGYDFAPDLSGIGLRSQAKAIVESMLKPSAAITEGYSQQKFVTREGRSIVGVVIREMPAEITVFRNDRTILTLEASSIEERRKLKQSAMPEDYALFGEEQIADLTAFLLTLRHRQSNVQHPDKTNIETP